MVRAAAKNHASRGDRDRSPARYDAVLAALDAEGAVPAGLRAALAVEAFRHTAAYDARIAEVLPGRMAAAGVALPDEPGLPGAADPYPARLTVALEKVETLRYGENPHQPAARYRRPGATVADGPFATGAPPLQGKALCYNNVLDASAAAGLGRLLRGPGLRHRQAHQPVRRRRAGDARGGLGRRPRRRPGLGLRRGRRADPGGRPRGRRAAGLHLPRGRRGARRSTPAALEVLAAKPNLRLVVDPAPGRRRAALPAAEPDRLAPDRRRRRPRHRAGHRPRRPGRLDRRHAARPDRRRAARPRPRLAPRPRRHLATRSCSSATGC